jgi:hypothetical protein
MALFGEYNINNEFDLSVSLESLVKSLGVTLLSTSEAIDSAAYIDVQKSLSVSINTPTDTTRYSFSKQLATTLDAQLDVLTQAFNKVISTSTGFTEEYVQFTDAETLEIGKGLSTIYAGFTETVSLQLQTVLPSETATLTEIPLITTDKYIEPSIIDNITDVGYVVINPFEYGDYFEEFFVKARDDEFSEI